MLSANVSEEELEKLPDDSSEKAVFNYDDGGLGGIDVSSLGDYSNTNTEDEAIDDNIYSDDDEDYTFIDDPSSIQISDMDK